MSGPLRQPDRECRDERLAGVELREGRRTEVGGLAVTRVLPTKGRRTVGAWCFTDLMGPADAEQPDPMEVAPHPHIGLATVTWLLQGEALHSDSLGTEQVVRPGELNLMTAGHGVAHAELAARPPFRGVQMWVAQPERTRHGSAAFEHHAALPQVELDGATALVFLGALAAVRSPARVDSPLLGADITLHERETTVPLEQDFEYAVVPLDGRSILDDELVEPGWCALVPAGRTILRLASERPGARLLLLGGRPLGERVEMWWNFVARDRAEIEAAWRDWRDRTDRFGQVASRRDRVEAPRPPWVPAGRS